MQLLEILLILASAAMDLVDGLRSATAAVDYVEPRGTLYCKSNGTRKEISMKIFNKSSSFN
jgi:hypothetical protein